MKLPIRTERYFPEALDVEDISNLKRWTDELENFSLDSPEQITIFLEKVDELAHKIADFGAEIYIAMTRNTADKTLAAQYSAFQANIVAYYAQKDFNFKSKFLDSPACDGWVRQHASMGALLYKILEKDHNIFREENIPLAVKESELGVEYRTISGGMTVDFRGEEKTLPEMGVFLKDKDRNIREQAWKLRSEKMLEHEQQLNILFDRLYDLRQEAARNAGFSNYRDYVHTAKGRFSYTVDDVFAFHDAVEHEMLPLIAEFNNHRKQTLNLDTLRPWDMAVSLDGKMLKPVANPADLVLKGVEILTQVDPEFGQNFQNMSDSDLLDLLNRKNKAPGGYSYPLYKYGASFIFMNAVGIHSDLTTLVHEAGHAMHEFARANHPYTSFLDLPMESAELASMSMEMLTMPHWNICYTDPGDFRKAQKDQLEDALRFFPWCMTVDAFQQEIYTQNADAPAREQIFIRLSDRFSASTGVDWSGLEEFRKIQWMFQLHIFEVPFYYIEYGIAQLGALALYRFFRHSPKQAVQAYKDFLNAGTKKSLTDIYKTAGIELNFSREYVREIVDFVREELSALS